MRREHLLSLALLPAVAGITGCDETPTFSQIQTAAPTYSETCVTSGVCELPGITAVGTQSGPTPIGDQNPIVPSSCMFSTAYSCEEAEGGGGATGSSIGTGEFAEGPLLWAVCVLAVLNSTHSVWQVADQFEAWWDAYRAYEVARRTWQATLDNPLSEAWETANAELKMQYARDRMNDARDAVSEATDASGWALAGAALACGATAIIPSA